MRRRLVYLLLAASLAGNAVELTVVAVSAWRRERQQTESINGMRRSPGRRSLRPLLGLYPREQERLNRHLIIADERLLMLGNSENPDPAAVQAVHDTLAQVQRENYWLIYRTGREVRHIADPDKRRTAERQWRMMMDLPPDSTTARPRPGRGT
jgi:hypothetical protein